MSYKKTSQQEKDFSAVLFGKVHNIGAGGVSILNAIDTSTITKKRIRQEMARCHKAVGWRHG